MLRTGEASIGKMLYTFHDEDTSEIFVVYQEINKMSDQNDISVVTSLASILSPK